MSEVHFLRNKKGEKVGAPVKQDWPGVSNQYWGEGTWGILIVFCLLWCISESLHDNKIKVNKVVSHPGTLFLVVPNPFCTNASLALSDACGPRHRMFLTPKIKYVGLHTSTQQRDLAAGLISLLLRRNEASVQFFTISAMAVIRSGNMRDSSW